MNPLNTAMPHDTSLKTHVSLNHKMKMEEVGSKVPYGYVKRDTKIAICHEKADNTHLGRRV